MRVCHMRVCHMQVCAHNRAQSPLRSSDDKRVPSEFVSSKGPPTAGMPALFECLCDNVYTPLIRHTLHTHHGTWVSKASCHTDYHVPYAPIHARDLCTEHLRHRYQEQRPVQPMRRVNDYEFCLLTEMVVPDCISRSACKLRKKHASCY